MRSPREPEVLSLWLVLPAALTGLATLGTLTSGGGSYPTWAEVLLVVACIGLILGVFVQRHRARSGRR